MHQTASHREASPIPALARYHITHTQPAFAYGVISLIDKHPQWSKSKDRSPTEFRGCSHEITMCTASRCIDIQFCH
jgi:hypothetical protein